MEAPIEIIVYALTCVPTGKVYVGQTRRSLAVRWREHVKNALRRGERTKLYAAIRKYGAEAFTSRALQVCASLADADTAEREWVRALDTQRSGLNLAPGGNGPGLLPETRAKLSAAGLGRKHNDETRRRMSESMRGKKRTPEACARISAAKKGTPCSPETRAKMSAVHSARPRLPHTEEAKAKIRAAALGRRPSEETRARMRASQLGRKHSAETKQKMRESHRGPLSPESIAKMARSLTGRTLSERHRRSISAGLSRHYGASTNG